MEQEFWQVFAGLEVREKLHLMFEEVTLVKVVSVMRQNRIKIKIRSGHLIPYKDLRNIEKVN